MYVYNTRISMRLCFTLVNYISATTAPAYFDVDVYTCTRYTRIYRYCILIRKENFMGCECLCIVCVCSRVSCVCVCLIIFYSSLCARGSLHVVAEAGPILATMEAQLKAWQDILKNTLEPQLAALEAEYESQVDTAGEYSDLKILISALMKRRDGPSGKEPLSAMCETKEGSGKYECVEVPDASMIHVDLGEGDFTELPLDDAMVAVEKRQKHYERLGVNQGKD